MTVLAQTLEKLKLWAATGFQEDKDFACEREKSTWDGEEFSKLADANCDSIIEQHSQLRAMDADNVQSLVAEFFDQASHLPPDDFVRVMDRLRYEFLDGPYYSEKRIPLTEVLKPEAPIPDDWWVNSDENLATSHFSWRPWREMMDDHLTRTSRHHVLDLTSGTPACRRMIHALLAKAWQDSTQVRDRKIVTLLAADPHYTWSLVCEHFGAGEKGGPITGLTGDRSVWLVNAVRQYGSDQEHGATRATRLYRKNRQHVKMALLGDEGAVARLIKLADGHMTAELPVEKDDPSYVSLPTAGDQANIRSLPTPLRLADLALYFGTGGDIEALAQGGVNWSSFQIEVKCKSGRGPGHVSKVVGPVEAALMMENPHALDIWEALVKNGAKPDDPQALHGILLAASAWKGGRPRRMVDASGLLSHRPPTDESAAQTQVADMVERWVPTTPTVWRRHKPETHSVFLSALHAGNVRLANRALSILGSAAAKEYSFMGNACHALMALPASLEAQTCLRHLLALGVAHASANSHGETPGDVLARQPSERRAGWLAAATRMGATWVVQASDTATTLPKTKPGRREGTPRPDAFNASALERRRRAEDLAERAARRRADPDGDLWDTSPESQPPTPRRRSPRG